MALIAAVAGCSCAPHAAYRAPAAWRAAADAFFFVAEPPVIEAGGTSVLRWNVPGATSVVIEQAAATDKLRPLGEFAATGTVQVNPTQDSTYVISCQGAAVSCASVVVRVRTARR